MGKPNVTELLSSISSDNTGFVKSQYPYEYAHRFITAYPETIPADVLQPAYAGSLSSPAREVSRILHKWANVCGVPAKEMAETLADAYVSRHFGQRS